MIPFDIDKITFQHVRIKRTTTGSGGMVRVLDEEASSKNNEVFVNLKSDWSLVRRFKKINEQSEFLEPVLGCIAWYDGVMIALEKHAMGDVEDEETIGDHTSQWKSNIENNLDWLRQYVAHDPMIPWFVDGYQVYRFIEAVAEEDLSSDGAFAQVPAICHEFKSMDSKDIFEMPKTKMCLRFRTEGNVLQPARSALSAPIWRNLAAVGQKELKNAAEDDDSGVVHKVRNTKQFDRVDKHLAVNVDFALKAANDLQGPFGIEVSEPLNLDTLIVKLGTVNLPGVARSIRKSYDIGIQFTHALAWLIGLTDKTHTLESYMAVRGVMKYLTGAGVYRKKAMEHSALFHKGCDINSVPHYTREEALEAYEKNVQNLDWDEFLRLQDMKAGRNKGGKIQSAGGLMNAD